MAAVAVPRYNYGPLGLALDFVNSENIHGSYIASFVWSIFGRERDGKMSKLQAQ